jgi:hypothetical protein
MNVKTAATVPLSLGRHCLGAVRALSPATLIAVTLALVVGGAGFADAATGGTFILGKANDETTQASLNNTKGTPLKLIAPANSAPLKVSNSNLVPGLNAQYLSGMSTSQLATGGDGFTPPGTSTPLGTSPTLVASTGALPAGTYYATATALLNLNGAGAGYCYIAKKSNPGTSGALSYGAGTAGLTQATETTAATVTAGDTLQESCFINFPSAQTSTAYNAGITAIRILSSSGTAPATTEARAPLPRPAPHTG